MPIDVAQFKGEAPRIAPRLLPNAMGQASENSRVISGNLEAWAGFANGQAGQVIVPIPVTIWYMNDQLWLSWSQPTTTLGTGVVQKWVVAQGTPFFDISLGFSPVATDKLPVLYSITSTTITTIDFCTAANWSTTPPASPGSAPVGDQKQYPTAVGNGAPGTPSTWTAAQAAYWGSIWAEVTQSQVDLRYPGAGNTAHCPYGGQGFVFNGPQEGAIALVLQPSGYICVCDGEAPKPITGGVSGGSFNEAELWVLDPIHNTAIYDVIPALSGSPSYVIGALPCVDGAHLVVLTGSTSSAANKWHLMNLTATGATEISSGPWTSGPELMAGSLSSAGIPVGSSLYSQNTKGFHNLEGIVGCLESDLSHLWIVCNTQEFYLLQLTAGSGYSTVFHGVTNTNPFINASFASGAEGGATLAIIADQGNCAGIGSNTMTLWTRLAPGASEIDVAKEAIAGDTSWRTIFCGFDVPRFTDLGLASGLTSGGNPVTGSSTVAPNAGPYPIYYRKLGVSNPTSPPASSLVPAAAGSNAVKYTETFDNPTQWNLPPNGANTGASFQIVGGNPGAYLLVQSIGGFTAIAWKNFAFDQTQGFTLQADFSFIRAFNARLSPNDFIFFFGLDSSVSGSCIIFENQSGGVNVRFAPVANGVIGANISTTFIASGSIPSWHVDADPTFTGFIQSTQWATILVNIVPVTGATTSANVSFTVKIGGVTEFSASATGMPVAGSGMGAGTYAPPESYPDWMQMKIDNFIVTGTGAAAATQNLQTTSYLYTLVNDLGEESGPSPAMLNTDGSNFITRPIGQGVLVTLPGSLVGSGADPTYFQVNPGTFIPSVQLNGSTPSPSMNLYRAVTGNSGTFFLLVAANIPFSGGATTTYTDTLPDTALSEVIPSLFTLNNVTGFWSPPPTNMLGILALANQIYAGFAGNILCLSVQAVPHAWPIVYQLIFDYDIVGIEAVDVSIVVCTKKFPYFVSGNTPDQMSSTKATYPYACASKRSIKFLKGVGVVYATFEGLVAIAGPGQERVLTENLFSKREWLALNPSSFIAEVNDGRYFCSYTTASGAQGAFYIDVMDQGSGKISLGWHFTARYNDPLTDILYIVPDFVDPAIPIGVPLQNIAGFEQAPASPLPYVWKSKQYYVTHPTCFKQARIQAETFASVVLTLFADGVQYAQITVASNVEFALPPPSINGTSPGTVNKYFEFEISSPDFVNRVQFVEDPEEWAAMA